jgi:hypothetical protein
MLSKASGVFVGSRAYMLLHCLPTATMAYYMRVNWEWPAAESLDFIGLRVLMGAVDCTIWDCWSERALFYTAMFRKIKLRGRGENAPLPAALSEQFRCSSGWALLRSADC